MTKFQKQMLTIAAAGALTAVTALPAMAFENEFHGMYNFNTVFSNYNNGGGGDFNPGTAGSVTVTNAFAVNPLTGAIVNTPVTTSVAPWGDKRKVNNYMEQRARIQYIAKASDDLKLVTHFEINNRFGGGAATYMNNATGTTTSLDLRGGDLDSDSLTLLTKNVYLDFNIGKSFNTKIGIMPYKDTIKGLLIDADVPAVMTTTKMGAYTLGLGFSRFADDQAQGVAGVARAGDRTKDLFIMDNIFALSKDTKMAFSYYFLNDNASSNTGYTLGTSGILWAANTGALFPAHLHTFALSGETKVGAVNLSGFVAAQAGYRNNTAFTFNTAPYYNAGSSSNLHGWAANIAANAKVGSGKAKAAFLFTSGANTNDAASYNGWISSSVNSYNESGMMILARNTYNSPTSTDAYIRRDVTNIALATIGYDAQLTDKFNFNTNIGMAWAPSSNNAPIDQKASILYYGAANNVNARNGSDYMGTEINLEAGYQLYKNLKVMALGGYVMLGGYYKDSTNKPGYNAANSVPTALNIVTPENPYTMRLQARYAF